MNAASITQALPLNEARAIAESIFGGIEWRGADGYCPCPGTSKHTTGTTERDLHIVLEPMESGLKPGAYCFHSSCTDEVESASYQLRSALGRRSPLPTKRQTPRYPITPKPKPEFDPAKLLRIAAKLDGIDAAWLAARSSVQVDNRTPASFLHALYEPGEKVVVFDVFESQGQHVWTSRQPPFDARELDSFRTAKQQGVWFLTNPVDGAFRENDSGAQSRRSWQNITSWRYLMLESDKANPVQWLAVLAQMPLRIAAIYTSGGKSIHALVRLNAKSKTHWNALCDAMKPALVTLGADQKALSAVRLSRLPGCERVEKGDIQTLLYLNPEPTRKPICEMPVIAPGWANWQQADQDGKAVC